MPLVQEITDTEELISGAKRDIISSNMILGVATKTYSESVTTEAKLSSAVMLSDSFNSG